MWLCPADPLLDRFTGASNPWWHYNGYFHVGDNTTYRTSYGYNTPSGVSNFDLHTMLWGLYDIVTGVSRQATDISNPGQTLLFVEASINRTWSVWMIGIPYHQALELDPFHRTGTVVNLSATDGHAVTFAELLPTPTGSPWSRAPWMLPEYWYRVDE